VVEARSHLRTAQRLLEGIGAATWEAHAQAELRAAGVRPPGQPGREPNDAGARLSPQQREIVRLVGAGLTNRQIAERLYLSPRTVGTHLYRIFPKLDVTSRTQLVSLVET
jgi:DNA-binding NarL/FixJ family response regulator